MNRRFRIIVKYKIIGRFSNSKLTGFDEYLFLAFCISSLILSEILTRKPNHSITFTGKYRWHPDENEPAIGYFSLRCHVQNYEYHYCSGPALDGMYSIP